MNFKHRAFHIEFSYMGIERAEGTETKVIHRFTSTEKHYHFWVGEAEECEHRLPEHCAPGTRCSCTAGGHAQGAAALPGAATAAAASATPGTIPAALTGKSEKRVTD